MKIVYFDGYCNVCNRFVDFLIRRDHQRRLKFASIQSTTAQQRLPAHYTNNVSTMVFEDDGKITDQSEAAIRSIAALGGLYSLMKLFLWVPGFLRDRFYRFVADHRYLWFGKRDTCRIASPEEKLQFLD